MCKFVAESLKEIEKLQNSVNFENLIYYCSIKDIDFNDLVDAETLFHYKVKKKKKDLKDVEKLKWNLNQN